MGTHRYGYSTGLQITWPKGLECRLVCLPTYRNLSQAGLLLWDCKACICSCVSADSRVICSEAAVPLTSNGTRNLTPDHHARILNVYKGKFFPWICMDSPVLFVNTRKVYRRESHCCLLEITQTEEERGPCILLHNPDDIMLWLPYVLPFSPFRLDSDFSSFLTAWISSFNVQSKEKLLL